MDKDLDFNSAHSMGTTIIDVTYNGGVVLGADSRTSTGIYVANRASDKITKITDNVYVCRSGSELLALEERIGNVCTGLSQETISSRMKQRKYIQDTMNNDQTEPEPYCVCQLIRKKFKIYSEKDRDSVAPNPSYVSMPSSLLGGHLFYQERKPCWQIALV